MEEARITDIRPMLELCTVEIVEDVPVRGDVGSRHLFARSTMTGTISFDLDSVSQRVSGDTLYVKLPPEIVEVRESTEPDSYVVIDTWNDGLLRSGNITTAEENRFKAAARERFRRQVYDKGYVRRAREEAAANLTQMLSTLRRQPVVVEM